MRTRSLSELEKHLYNAILTTTILLARYHRSTWVMSCDPNPSYYNRIKESYCNLTIALVKVRCPQKITCNQYSFINLHKKNEVDKRPTLPRSYVVKCSA